MRFKLSKYIIPSVISMVLVGTYTNIDGFFIGNVAGDSGLAAINIVWPIVAFITSLGTGIGVGGSVLLTNMRGAENNAAAEQVKRTLLLVLTAAGIITGIVMTTVYRPLLVIMGAEGKVLEYAASYALIVCGGAVFQIMGAGLLAVLRNENKTYQSMAYSIVGLVIHIVLDMLLTKKYMLSGVAASTVVSQAAIMVLGLISLRVEKGAWIKREYISDILKRTTAPFGVNFVPSVVLLLTNYFALRTGGTAAVSAYAVMSYAVYTFDYIFQGVCDGVQPVISYCCGSGDRGGEKRAMKCAAAILGAFSLFSIALTPALIRIMPRLFSVSTEAEAMMRTGFVIYAVSYPFKAAVKYICSYYYASGRTRLSNLLTYLDPFLLTPCLLLILPRLCGMDGIWLAMTLAQAVLSAVGALTLKEKMKALHVV